MMKRLTIVTDPFEAQIITEKLRDLGIEAESRGVREYASIITGSQQGRYEILVTEADLPKAQEALRVLSLNLAHTNTTDTDHRPPNYLKRAVAFAIFGTAVVPIVFNVFSVTSLRKYWEQSPKDKRTRAIVFIVLLFQLPALFMSAVILKTLLK